MLIRPFQTVDAEQLAALFHASVREAGIRDYSAEQVEAWSPAPPDPMTYVRRSLDGRLILVATDDAGEPIGYADLELNGYIDHLYCHPDVVRTGVGSALYDAIKAVAMNRGITSLFVRASEAAHRLFEHKGFAVQRRNDFSVNGVPIHNYQMVRMLTPSAE